MNTLKQAKEAIEAEDYQHAIDLLKSLAENDEPEAQFLLGYLYFTNADVTKEQSLDWMRRAAAQDHPEAYYYLFRSSDWVHFTPPIDTQGCQLLRKAAELGSAEAQRDLGCYYAIGDSGLPKNKVKSRKWYTLAAKQGHVDAQYNLGLMWLSGDGGPKSIDKAIYWLTQSASQTPSDPMQVNAAEILADIYERGLHSVKPDAKASKRWRNRAMELNKLSWRKHPDWFYD